MWEIIFMTFEQALPEIDRLIRQQRGRWRLETAHIDYDDVSQILRLHLFNKWSQYNPAKPLINWASRVIHRKLLNILVQYYGRFSPPSSFECKCYEGRKCRKCKIWEQKKKTAYLLNFAESTDTPEYSKNNVDRISHDYGDDEERVNILHKRMLETLPNDKLKNVYIWLFMERKDEEYVAEKLELKTSEEKRKPGYRQIQNYKNILIEHARKLTKEEDLYGD